MADTVGQRPRWTIAPYFIAGDVVATANYYRDKLGFVYERFWNEPPSFDADALYTEFKSKGVTIARDICDQPYGCRDFDIDDCNGYRLCFGQDIAG